MLAMRDVLIGASGNAGQVPGLTVLVAFLLVVVSIAVLVLYVHHIGRSLRVSALIELVGSKSSPADDTYPGQDGRAQSDALLASRSGVLVHVDVKRLVAAAQRADCTLELVPAVGEFVAAGAPLVRIEGDRARLPDWLEDTLELGLERTLEHYVAYGFRMLVDIAERSLAESAHLDPTTAVQAIDRLHDNLRHLARRRFPDGLCRDERGEVRLVVPVMSWQAYVHLAFDEIRQAVAGSPQVARRMRAALDDLLDYAPPERRPVVHEKLTLLDAAIRDRVPEQELPAFLVADRQGIVLAATPGVTFP